MPFIAVEHVISVVPCRLPCPYGYSREHCQTNHWGYRATCAAEPRWRGPRRPTFAEAEQDGLAHLRKKGQEVRG